MKVKYLFFALCCLPLSVAYSADNKVHEKVLSNGLKVLIKEDHRSPVVVTQIWYKVGSSYEPNGITGISHMLEHMMFKGTANYPDGEFSKIIAENGGNENAFTGQDYTAYFQTLEKSRLEISFKLEADRMRNLNLQKKDLVKELEVVTEERRMRTDDNPSAKMYEQFSAMVYTSSPYKNPVIGWPADIAAYQIDDLKTWYQRWYAPNNATLVVVGDIEAPAVFALAEKYFGAIKTSKIQPLKPQIEMEQHGVRTMTMKIPAKLPSLLMGYKVPVLNTIKDRKEAYALEVLANVLDGGDSARLSKKLIRGQQVALSASASYSFATRLDNLFTFSGVPVEGKSIAMLEKAIKAEINLLKKELVKPEELARIKAQVLAAKIYEQDSNFYQAMVLGILETVGIGWPEMDRYVAQITQVTAEQVRAVAIKYLVDDKLSIGYLDPQPMNQPEKTAAVKGTRNAN
ncbi:MAG: insulinase family protein [Methylococcales bacterium]|nr:insulinase family protein [Methylococcales bacterium]